MKIISQIDFQDGKDLLVQKNDDGLYDVVIDGVVTQPGHDAEGIIRALSHYLQDTCYKLEKAHDVIRHS